MPCWAYAFQTSYTISGKVKDKKGEALAGANVLQINQLVFWEMSLIGNHQAFLLLPGNSLNMVVFQFSETVSRDHSDCVL